MDLKVKPRAYTNDVPVYCTYDELLSIEKLVENPKNPNMHSEEQIELLAKVIEKQGWRQNITISKRSGFIVKGHGRLKAAFLIRLNKVPVEYQEYATEAEEWADMVADNKLAELSEIDKNALSELLKELEKTDIDLLLLGYDENELEDILKNVTEELQVKDEDFILSEDIEKKEKTHTIICPKCGEVIEV